MPTYSKPLVILVVEDDEDDRELLQIAFNEGDYKGELFFANDGEHAWQLLNDGSVEPSLLLLDINMPRLNGMELLEKLKSTLRFKALPVLMFTTSSNEGMVRKAYELGANSYVVKPQNFQRLSEIWDQVYSYWTQMIQLPSRD
ncbi:MULTISPECIES: response regulator [unclassified Siphonobacter]|uniref:response regulator n=1 Tax=unclassified Siphonobacter TaxID=2635712 RepID=UPI002787863C|nr:MULTISPECIES: response regulator [unclassified Siphonobacter]MDQ1090113.1 CheY-like chemotaxis protein [Siphonobacter sp. SORGH_AS_1065]MDR6197543.1 CheY-like chemotaxis protein [Siphonobacter sp. SORGH_AS_0500]